MKSLMLSTAAAMGAKAINWFYPDMSSKVQSCAQNYRNAPINEFGERSQTFEWMSVENRHFQRQYATFTFAPSVKPMQRVFTREYAKLSTNADPVAERDAGRRGARAGCG